MKKISVSKVRELRDLTGASILECREALVCSGEDVEKAREFLRKKGKEKAQKKSDRLTKEGIIACYIHSNKKIGAMVELRCETDFVAKNSEFQELAYELAMHVAAMAPQFISFAEVPKKEKEEIKNSFQEELITQKKPEDIVKKIIDGKLKKHFEQICLYEQGYIKDSNLKVSELIKEKIARMGENIQVTDFCRFEI